MLGLVQKLHFPFGIQFEFAGNSANEIGANAGQFVPGGIAISKLGALTGGAGIPAIPDAKEIERHGTHPIRWDRSRAVETPQDCQSEDSRIRDRSIPGVYGLSAAICPSPGEPRSRLFALGNPDQAVAGDDRTFGGHDDVAKADQLCQVKRRYRRVGRGDRDLDQRGELFGRQKLGCMDGHLQLAIKPGRPVGSEGRIDEQRWCKTISSISVDLTG